MRIKKIRGHKRRWKKIEEWVELSKKLDINLLKESEREYSKIAVAPWSGISVVGSSFPEPNGKTRLKIINGLFEIYNSWKIELDKEGEPYYLKIWLFEPNISNSQVVCSIGGSLDFYEDSFFKPDSQIGLDLKRFKNLKNDIDLFDWVQHYEEMNFSNIDLKDFPEYYERYLDKPHRLEILEDKVEFIYETHTEVLDRNYFVKVGDVWIVGRK